MTNPNNGEDEKNGKLSISDRLSIIAIILSVITLVAQIVLDIFGGVTTLILLTSLGITILMIGYLFYFRKKISEIDTSGKIKEFFKKIRWATIIWCSGLIYLLVIFGIHTSANLFDSDVSKTPEQSTIVTEPSDDLTEAMETHESTDPATLTPTQTKTATPSITPSPTLGLESACIPDYWYVFPYNFDSYKIIDESGCVSFPRLGISGIDSGIKIFKIPEGDIGVWGIYRQIESNSFDIKFRLSITSFDVGAFYFGFINPEETDIKDDMFKIQKDPNKYFSYLKFENDLIQTEITEESEILIIISVDDSANLEYDISYKGEHIKNTNNQYTPSNDHFFIGYYFGVSQTLKLELLEFEITEY